MGKPRSRAVSRAASWAPTASCCQALLPHSHDRTLEATASPSDPKNGQRPMSRSRRERIDFYLSRRWLSPARRNSPVPAYRPYGSSVNHILSLVHSFNESWLQRPLLLVRASWGMRRSVSGDVSCLLSSSSHPPRLAWLRVRDLWLYLRRSLSTFTFLPFDFSTSPQSALRLSNNNPLLPSPSLDAPMHVVSLSLLALAAPLALATPSPSDGPARLPPHPAAHVRIPLTKRSGLGTPRAFSHGGVADIDNLKQALKSATRYVSWDAPLALPTFSTN